MYHRCRATPPKNFGVAPFPPSVPGGVAPKFGSEKVPRYMGLSQAQLRVFALHCEHHDPPRPLCKPRRCQYTPHSPLPWAFETAPICLGYALLILQTILENPVTSLNKESRHFFLGDNSIWSLPSVSSLSDYSISRFLKVFLSLATIAFGAVALIVPKYCHCLGKMEIEGKELGP